MHQPKGSLLLAVVKLAPVYLANFETSVKVVSTVAQGRPRKDRITKVTG